MSLPNYLSDELKAELARVANAIVAPGKGILAADESTGECFCHAEITSCESSNQTKVIILSHAHNLYSSIVGLGAGG